MNLQQQLTQRRRDAMWREVLKLKQERRTRMDPQPTEDRPVVWFLIVALLIAGFLAGAGAAILTQ